MSASSSTMPQLSALRQAQALLDERYVPLAQAILPGMFLEHASVFCNVARPGPALPQPPNTAPHTVFGVLHPAGISRRYTAMTLMGLAAQQQLGRGSPIAESRDWGPRPAAQVLSPEGGSPIAVFGDWGPRLRRAWQHMLDWALTDASLGDAGLVLWGLCLSGQLDRAEQVTQAILKRQREVLGDTAPFASMEMGWLGTGLAYAWSSGVGGAAVSEMCLAVGRRLMDNYHAATGLFSFGRPVRRKNIFTARVEARLGSFASQVYPIIALSRLAAVSGHKEPLEAAGRCVETICRLQGPQGQWWWIYDVHSGRVAMKYPVYSVHQHAMGPMALLAYSAAAGTSQYDEPLLAGLKWLDDHPELPEVAMVGPTAARTGEPARPETPNAAYRVWGPPVIWRAIQRHDHARTGTLGLSFPDRLRLHLAAWTGRADQRPFKAGHLCDECRPYCFGWMLLAAAWARSRQMRPAAPEGMPQERSSG